MLGRIRYVIEMLVQTNSKSDKVQVKNKKSFFICLVLYKSKRNKKIMQKTFQEW